MWLLGRYRGHWGRCHSDSLVQKWIQDHVLCSWWQPRRNIWSLHKDHWKEWSQKFGCWSLPYHQSPSQKVEHFEGWCLLWIDHSWWFRCGQEPEQLCWRFNRMCFPKIFFFEFFSHTNYQRLCELNGMRNGFWHENCIHFFVFYDFLFGKMWLVGTIEMITNTMNEPIVITITIIMW